MQSLPDKEMLQAFPSPWLVLIDDQGSMAFTSQFCLQLWTIYAHHLSGVCFLTTQNPFMKSNPIARTISINSSCLVFMRLSRDLDMIKRFGRSIFGSNWKVMYEAYTYLQKQSNYPYLVCDLSSKGDQKMKLRSGIFDTELTTCFLPRNGTQL